MVKEEYYVLRDSSPRVRCPGTPRMREYNLNGRFFVHENGIKLTIAINVDQVGFM